jgi:hypothetical protein
MQRSSYESESRQATYRLLPVYLLGGTALGGVLNEAGHNNTVGALIYLGLGLVTTIAAGIVAHHKNSQN